MDVRSLDVGLEKLRLSPGDTLVIKAPSRIMAKEAAEELCRTWRSPFVVPILIADEKVGLEVRPKTTDLLAESLDILYSQLEKQIVTSRLNPENLAIETWTECDETSFRVCARFVPRKEAV